MTPFERMAENWTQQWEANTSKYTEQLLRNQKVLEQLGRSVFKWSSLKSTTNQMMERWYALMRLPSRTDMAHTLHNLHQIDMKMARIDQSLRGLDLRLAQIERHLEQVEAAPTAEPKPKPTRRKRSTKPTAKNTPKSGDDA